MVIIIIIKGFLILNEPKLEQHWGWIIWAIINQDQASSICQRESVKLTGILTSGINPIRQLTLKQQDQ